MRRATGTKRQKTAECPPRLRLCALVEISYFPLLRDAATTEADERLAEAVLRNVTEKAQPIPAVCTERRSTGDCHVQPTGDMEQKSSLQTSLAERSREDGAAENIKVFYQRNEMLYHDEQG